MKAEVLKQKLKNLFSPFFIVAAAMFVFGLTVRFVASKIPAFADFWQSKIATVPRAALAYLTNLLPFSLAEYFLLCIPLLVRTAVKGKIDSWTSTFRYTFNLVAVAAVVFSVFLINFSAGYFTTPLDERLGLERTAVSAEDLYNTAQELMNGIDDCIDNIDFAGDGSSVMPYDLKELNRKLNDAYKKAHDKYPFLSNFYSSPKPVALSEPWTYTHVAGVYTFFTGEANVNFNFPDYTLPFTTAHEMAHQRGISREEEANFIAFLVCLESDDDYIRYSAYVNTFEYVASSLNEAARMLRARPPLMLSATPSGVMPLSYCFTFPSGNVILIIV